MTVEFDPIREIETWYGAPMECWNGDGKNTWGAWALKEHIHPLVRAFLQFRPYFVGGRRAWGTLSDFLKRGSHPTDFVGMMGTMLLGEPALLEFIAFASQYKVDLDLVLEGCTEREVNEIKIDPPRIYLLIALLVERARKVASKHFDARVVEIAEMLGTEWACMLVRDLVQVRESNGCHAVGKWVRAHSDLFLSVRKDDLRQNPPRLPQRMIGDLNPR